ncbi:MAG TPA: hypothetical protein DIS53_03750 [Candidatus Wildermuthbacteria bacterium]|uniref:Uncharacterized protein n=1 Tax=Candidatus Yanofskybacteria bacterium GW2011_GWC1_48_11 TaxID=1619027 RepID=A0A837ISH4_9BACT|nr:MAG: hypothetical protein UY25_C0002G0010 [Candidatus Yanofskybacteria bacterium GW2011_GWC1_48_11]KKW04741.1 MAG: hypothetical protein UY38_C0001G0308 [Parcubacteria group bacterium GW2011_GWB1_49_12]KKW08958.1 MAG: hypothetical protein UY45_C0002G0010 [Parcubacteria group bacterium GW2011_GWA1_49_26]KKW14273.1 MAG: hypothetical protein UY53_C0002G0062 [Parcubacteria group bacterium GW2011_GWA2_50_10]HCM37012.1 hypothetical protein [Candidatus Wildermuthbacteria bacterium]
MEIKIIKENRPIRREELSEMARDMFGDMVKAVVDVEQGIMAVGGEFHSEEEVVLMEKEGSKREHTWGINFYPENPNEEFIEFDSMVNIKPSFGNRSRNIEDPAIHQKIKEIVKKLVSE